MFLLIKSDESAGKGKVRKRWLWLNWGEGGI